MSQLSDEEKAKIRRVVLGICNRWQEGNDNKPLVDLATAASVPYSSLLRWRAGNHTPSARYLIRLLDVDAGGGAAQPNVVAPQDNSSVPGEDPLAEMRGAVVATLAVANAIDERLARVEQSLLQAAVPPQAAAAGKTRRKTGP